MIRVAILDLYHGFPNQGMRCIRQILAGFSENAGIDSFVVDEFDVRQKLEVPGLDYDIYISSGGPGSPLESADEPWDKNYINWLASVETFNADNPGLEKHVFFICHSFQLACRYYKLAQVCARKSTAFGVFPVHMLEDAFHEPVFSNLGDPFYAVDSRDWQVIQPNHNRLRQLKATILCIEKERPHVPFERAIMAIRFNEFFIGTQFHPEADATGMSMYLQTEEKKKTVIDNYGEQKWQNMIDQLNDPEKIRFTYDHILPNFLHASVQNITKRKAFAGNTAIGVS